MDISVHSLCTVGVQGTKEVQRHRLSQIGGIALQDLCSDPVSSHPVLLSCCHLVIADGNPTCAVTVAHGTIIVTATRFDGLQVGFP